MASNTIHLGPREVYLQVVPVRVVGSNGGEVETHAILDSCGQATLIKDDISGAMGLGGLSANLWLDTVSDPSQKVESKQVCFSVTACSFKGDTIPVTSAYSDSKDNSKIRYNQHLPAGFSDKVCFKHLKGLGFKDVNADDITLLIGANVLSAIIATEVREGPKDTPHSVLTSLGWSLFGQSKGCLLSDKMVSSSNHMLIGNEKCLDELVQSFWIKE